MIKHLNQGQRATVHAAIALITLSIGIAVWAAIAMAQTSTSTAASTTSGSGVASPVCSLSASPSTIAAGGSSLLSWNSTGALTGTLDNALGTISSVGSGSMTVTPTTTTRYTGTFVGSAGTVTCETTLSVSGSSTTVSTLPATTYVTPNYYYGPTTSASTIYPSANASANTAMNAASTTSSVTPSSTGTTGSVTSGQTAAALGMLTNYPTPGSTPAAMTVQVDSAGRVLVRGTVITAGPNSIAIRSWGGLWVIRTNSAATVIPAGTSVGDLSGIAVGDFVGVDGMMATDQLYTVDASLVRDWTTNPYVSPNTNTASTEESSTSGAPTGSDATTSTSAEGTTTSTTQARSLYTGTASDVSGDSLILTSSDGMRYTIVVGNDTTLWDQSSDTISLSQIQPGDGIRLNGSLDPTTNTITATVVRDTSLPGTGGSAGTGTTTPANGATTSTSTSTGTDGTSIF